MKRWWQQFPRNGANAYIAAAVAHLRADAQDAGPHLSAEEMACIVDGQFLSPESWTHALVCGACSERLDAIVLASPKRPEINLQSREENGGTAIFARIIRDSQRVEVAACLGAVSYGSQLIARGTQKSIRLRDRAEHARLEISLAPRGEHWGCDILILDHAPTTIRARVWSRARLVTEVSGTGTSLTVSVLPQPHAKIEILDGKLTLGTAWLQFDRSPEGCAEP